MNSVLLWINHEIHAPERDPATGEIILETTQEIDPATGEIKRRVKSNILKPGRVYAVPQNLADELLTMAARDPANAPVREPTKMELVAYQMANNLLIAKE